jgi:hypothetical protein
VALHTCGRRAPESGNAPSEIELLPGGLNQQNSKTNRLLQQIDAETYAGAVLALRRRAARQRQIATDWTVIAANGARITSGEGAIALKIAGALDQAADELEGAAS